MDYSPARTVRYEHSFDEDAKRIAFDCRRLYEAIAGAEWAIARSPEKFPLLPNTELRKVDLKSLTGLCLWFEICDENTVSVYGLTKE